MTGASNGTFGVRDSGSGVAPPALVLGSGLTVLGVVRSLGREGISSHCTVPSGDPATWSRWYRPAAVPILPATLAQDLEASPYPCAVPIPCSDAFALAVARLPETLRGRFPTASAPADVVSRAANKGGLASVLREAGLPQPLTWPAHGPADLDAVPATAWADAFLKPRDSQALLWPRSDGACPCGSQLSPAPICLIRGSLIGMSAI